MEHVIVTGGSSGIGLEIARIYLWRGHKVSLLARRASLLEDAVRNLCEGHPEIIENIFTASVDVTDEECLNKAVLEAEAIQGPCGALVAAAGRVDPGFFHLQSSDLFNSQVYLNFVGVVNSVRAVHDRMRSRGRGRIMIVSSAAAHIGIPAYSAYCASKSALKGFSEALRVESQPFGVKISIAYPPDTMTPQYEREIRERPPQAERIMGVLNPWPAKIVAKRIVKGLDHGASEVHFGISLTMLSWFGSFIKPFIYWRSAFVEQKMTE